MNKNLLVEKLIEKSEDKITLRDVAEGFCVLIVKSFVVYLLWNFLATENFFIGGITFSSALCITMLVDTLQR